MQQITRSRPTMHPKNFLNLYKMSRKQFAAELGVSVDAVNSWMCDRVQPKLQTLRQIGDLAERLESDSNFKNLVLATSEK